ncbi:hypothetical protein JCM21714_3778 [Gracilibacillus boraciitolerans JCM 21714]|uniref:Uncharacterized protein n=1 Tax=Gracilibacillus boraciitolerans JCM 21714 TaxID=1298598 RepID=W4VPD0_9BACI|nr:DUF4173 domain-containing protein [Gracilibacillus boraciitolerans]GAE94604.1 hypothetical protein JCM21714_3778 [Gracilibacillus boraciitolerans JCM 21714]
MKQRQKSFLFLFVCLGLGILAELSFFHGVIGISYVLFIAAFYAILFSRLGIKFSHRRIGLLLMIMIWVLAASYLFYDNEVFYELNMLVIPVLVFTHIVLITTPNNIDWISVLFVKQWTQKFTQTFGYGKRWVKFVLKRTIFRRMSKAATQTLKRIVIGLLLGGPLLIVIVGLLISADANFGNVVMEVPKFILGGLNFLEGLFRVIAVIFLTLLFFSAFQTLRKRYVIPLGRPTNDYKQVSWDGGVIAGTILVLLNSIYLLFAVIQFKYFFGGEAIQGDLTYAEYARRGFFELVIVTVINWSLLLICLKLVNVKRKSGSFFMKIMYSLLIVTSGGVMLTSAYMRLSMYENAYGFTMDRIFAHTFMIFLIVIFAYTFIRVWLERISISHFYLIIGLIFYTTLNAINLEEIIVENNLERYQETGKIDIHYLDSLSYSGIDGLITLYEMEADYPELRSLLQDRKQMIDNLDVDTWQSFNFKKQQVVERLKELEMK